MSKMNEYAKVLSPEFYEKCPKAVFAAIAVSFAHVITGEDFDKMEDAIKEEWGILHSNHIVSQKPIK